MSRIYFILFLFLFSCKQSDFDNVEKRNENWCWFVDEKTKEGKWVPVTGSETDLPDGDYTLFFCNGKIRRKGKLKNRKDCDTIFQYDLNERLISKIYRLPDSTLKEVMPEGKYKSYYATCEPLGEGEVKNGKMVGTRLTYYKNGKIKEKVNIKGDSALLMNYYESGIICDSCFYVKEKLEGIAKTWHSNGKLKIHAKYKNGINNGFLFEYFESGQMSQESYWLEGVEDGKFLTWHENGKLKISAFSQKGIPNGQQFFYYENGKTQAVQEYSNGIRTGTWKDFDTLGNAKTYVFKNGELMENKK
jgi:antitoxin component YwqK of YwqJK toxin-antitoxin module